MADITVDLLEVGLDPAASHATFLQAHGTTGAVVSFAGLVRNKDKDAAIEYLYLDWYPGMTEASLRTIAEAAAERFDITALTIQHRCGQVNAGEPIVFVAAASRHRRAAFEAVDYMMDRLKSDVALWKREVGPATDRWVEPTQKDGDDLKRWNEKDMI